MSDYSTTKARIFQWVGIVLIMAVFAGAYWYFKVYGSTLNKSPTGSLTSGLVGYWTFDGADVSGTTATDRSGSSNTGTLTGGPIVINGRLGQALTFDGTDDEITTTINQGTASTLKTLTLSAWFKTSSASGKKIIGLQDTQYGGYFASYDRQIWIGTDGKVRFGVANSTPALREVASSGTFNDNNWHHVVGVSTGDSGVISLYVDGVLQGSTNLDTSVFTYSSNSYWRIGYGAGGSWTNAVDGYFSGSIDEVRVYNTALTATQIQSLYALGQSDPINSSTSQPQGTGRLDSGLAGYWKLDDGSGTSATDSSTNGNTGTLNNGPTWGTGQVGGAVVFDGSNDTIYIATVTGMNIGVGDKVTTAFWYNATVGNGTTQNFYQRTSGGCDQYIGSITGGASTDTLNFYYRDTGCGGIDNYQVSGITKSTWHHVVSTYNTTTGVFIAYVDGVQVATTTSIPGASIGSGTSLTLGAAQGGGSYFGGTLDEFRFYSRVLSADEVAQLYRLTSPTGVDTGLKGYWSFNAQDMSSTTAYDRSGAGNTATLNGPAITEGKIGQALSFDGTDDYVTMGDPSSLDFGTSDFSVSFWMRTTDTGNKRIVNKMDGSSYSAGWAIRNGIAANDLGIVLSDGSNYVDDYNVSAPGAQDGRWHHVIVVFDRDATAMLYLDGSLTDQTTSIASVGSVSNGLSLNVGVAGGGTPAHYTGAVDEVRVYNRVLTAAEIKGLYDVGESDKVNSSVSQAQGTGRPDSGLAGYWKLDDGSGTSAIDSSTNGNTGTLTASPTWSTGQIGGAVTFNDNYINIPDSNMLDGGTRSLSWSFWMKTSQDASSYSWPGIVAKEHNLTLTPRKGWISYLDTSSPNKVKCAVMYNDQSDIATSTNALNDNTWHHISCVRNVEGNRISIYVDGVLNETIALTNTGSNDISNSLPLEIGARNEAFSTNNGLVGQVDEVRVYNRALSADEAADLYRLTSPTGVDTGLKGYWSFNGKDISGTTAYDRSGAGNTGTLTSGPAITEGKIGQALLFDGSDDYVQITNSASLNPTYISIAAWIKTSAAGQVDQIFTKDNSGTGARVWQFRKSSSNVLEFIVFRDSDDTNSLASGSVTLSDNNWHHVVGTWDGTTIKVFVDGVQDGSGTAFSGVLNASQTNNAFFSLGEVGDGGAFEGRIDEIRLYNRALTDAEIYSLYNSGR